MPTISTGDVPEGLSEELEEYFNRKFVEINIALGNNGQMIKHPLMPNSISEGKVYYFSQPILPDIEHIGFWGYTDRGWVYLGSDHSVEAAYGGLRQVADAVYPNITDVWQTVQFDTPMLDTPKQVEQDVANNALTILDEGIYRAGFSFSVRHDEKNNGRALNFRMRNPTSGYVSDILSVGTGRDTDASYFSISMLFEAVDIGIGTDVIVEVRADTSDLKEIYENVIVTESTFDVNSVSGRER